MRFAHLVAALGLLATMPNPAGAQHTRDRPTLVFTISGAYIGNVGLWSVSDQPITDVTAGAVLTDHFALNRNISSTFGGAFATTYYKGANLGITAEALLLGLGYEDGCQIRQPAQAPKNQERCVSIPFQDNSSASVALSGGAVYRIAPEEFISPFARASVGMVINNQSPIMMVSEDANGAELTIYDDPDKGTRIDPVFGLGVGTTVAVGRAYHLRWEVRDNILGINAVTGPTADHGLVPPHERVFKHLFSIVIGLDVVLERRPGRRY